MTPSRLHPFVAFVLVAAVSGCATVPSQTLIPLGWRQGNPWGPEANAARADGRLVDRHAPPHQAEWEAFGRDHLQEGDLLLRKGAGFDPCEIYIGHLLKHICDSDFSHVGFVHREGNCCWIYDVDNPGVRRLPLAVWMMDVSHEQFAVYRLKPEFQSTIPAAFAFIEEQYRRQPPFDFVFGEGDDEFYCTELIEKAFRSAGLQLQEAVPLRCLPNYWCYHWLRGVVERVTPLRVDRPLYTLGNEHYGLVASPCLECVYPSPAVRIRPHKPPACRE